MRNMKGGGDDLIIFIILLCFCISLSIGGGLGYYFMDKPECDEDTPCETGKTCSASGVCIAIEHQQHHDL